MSTPNISPSDLISLAQLLPAIRQRLITITRSSIYYCSMDDKNSSLLLSTIPCDKVNEWRRKWQKLAEIWKWKQRTRRKERERMTRRHFVISEKYLRKWGSLVTSERERRREGRSRRLKWCERGIETLLDWLGWERRKIHTARYVERYWGISIGEIHSIYHWGSIARLLLGLLCGSLSVGY